MTLQSDGASSISHANYHRTLSPASCLLYNIWQCAYASALPFKSFVLCTLSGRSPPVRLIKTIYTTTEMLKHCEQVDQQLRETCTIVCATTTTTTTATYQHLRAKNMRDNSLVVTIGQLLAISHTHTLPMAARSAAVCQSINKCMRVLAT